MSLNILSSGINMSILNGGLLLHNYFFLTLKAFNSSKFQSLEKGISSFKGSMKTSLHNNGDQCKTESKSKDDISLKSTGRRFLDNFYDVPCEQLAKKLLGQVLVRQLENGKLLKGKIVETECYPGGEDKASHSYQGKYTERNAPMYMKPGTSYVYLTYGMYNCFNISSKGAGAAVLVRALEPLEGMDFMLAERIKKRKKVPSVLHNHQLANGPSKLCISLNINKESCNARDMCSWDGLWVEQELAKEGDDQTTSLDPNLVSAVQPHEIVSTSRIGIESAGKEWASKPYRFYILGNPSVSKRDKMKEKEIDPLCEVLSRKKRKLRVDEKL